MSIIGELTERNVNPRTRTCVCVRGRLHVVDGLLTVFGTEPRRQHRNKPGLISLRLKKSPIVLDFGASLPLGAVISQG